MNIMKNYPLDAKEIALAVAVNEGLVKRIGRIVDGQDVDVYSGEATVTVEGDRYTVTGLGMERWRVEGPPKILHRDTPRNWYDVVLQADVR